MRSQGLFKLISTGFCYRNNTMVAPFLLPTRKPQPIPYDFSIWRVPRADKTQDLPGYNLANYKTSNYPKRFENPSIPSLGALRKNRSRCKCKQFILITRIELTLLVFNTVLIPYPITDVHVSSYFARPIIATKVRSLRLERVYPSQALYQKHSLELAVKISTNSKLRRKRPNEN